MTLANDLHPEDAKIVTLARAAALRAYVPYGGAGEGAAVRDPDGRTYAGATVENRDDRLTVSALRAAVVAAASSGARELDGAAVVTRNLRVTADDLAALREFGSGFFVFLTAPDGTVVDPVLA